MSPLPHRSPMTLQNMPRSRIGLWLGFVACLLLAAQPVPAAQSLIRPAGTPDVLIMVFDGQNCTWATNPGHWSLLCDAKNNFDGLSWRPGFQAIAALLQQRGYTVEIRGYAGKFQGGVSSYTRRYERGFEDALRDLDSARGQWIAGYLNPTRLILVGSSVGSIWAHLAILPTQISPSTTLSIAILLACTGRATIAAFSAR